MSACCVSGCKNRHSSTGKLKFYRIPSGFRPFQANRRRLWLQAIQQVNAEEIKGNARICGAHFISGEASLDHDSPDFVPSVFTCSKPRASTKKKTKRYYGRRRRRRHKAKVEAGGKTSPPTADSSVDLQSSVSMDIESEIKEIQTPSDPSEPKDPEPLTKESERTSSPNKTSLSCTAPAGTTKLKKMSPIVLLKPIVSPTGGFQCEVCNQKVISLSELVKHKQTHKEENKSFTCETCRMSFTSEADLVGHQHDHTDQPSFSCNMCERSFTTNHNLKRHKLLHVKDVRKCPMCGVLFCRRHNHIAFQPQAEPVTDSEEDSAVVEQQTVDINLMSETSLLEDCPTKPELKTDTAPPSATHPEISEIPAPKLLKTLTLHPPLPVPIHPGTPGTSSQFAPLLSYPAAIIQPAPPKQLELPGSLKIFSPRFLTSALLDVKRNYEYILSKPGKVKKEIVKEEPCELPLISPDDLSAKQVKTERTAYDLEITL